MEKIKVSKKISKYLITRDTIRDLFRYIANINSNNIQIDFKEVSFISRSCADEYQKLKEISKKNIKELNLKKDVKIMIDLVKSQSNENQKECECSMTPPIFL